MPNKLPARFHHTNMDGNPIPHSVNPGPQLQCPGCKLSRFGSDFVAAADGAEPVCRDCASKPSAPKAKWYRDDAGDRYSPWYFGPVDGEDVIAVVSPDWGEGRAVGVGKPSRWGARVHGVRIGEARTIREATKLVDTHMAALADAATASAKRARDLLESRIWRALLDSSAFEAGIRTVEWEPLIQRIADYVEGK